MADETTWREDHLRHVERVRELIGGFIAELAERARGHDASKLTDQCEREGFSGAFHRLRGLTYGSPEYKAQLEDPKVGGPLTSAVHHHRAANRHHPEFHENGVLDMDLVDLDEMFADWVSACDRHDDGDIFKSIEHNEKRFGMGPVLTAVFVNTARRIKAREARILTDNKKPCKGCGKD